MDLSVGNVVMVTMFRFKVRRTRVLPKFSFRTVRKVCTIRAIDPDGKLFYVQSLRDRSLTPQWVMRSQIQP